jgi:hypothetical protein
MAKRVHRKEKLGALGVIHALFCSQGTVQYFAIHAHHSPPLPALLWPGSAKFCKIFFNFIHNQPRDRFQKASTSTSTRN